MKEQNRSETLKIYSIGILYIKKSQIDDIIKSFPRKMKPLISEEHLNMSPLVLKRKVLHLC